MAGTGGSPFLVSTAAGHAMPSSSAVFDVKAAAANGAHHHPGKPAAVDAGAAFVLESKGYTYLVLTSV